MADTFFGFNTELPNFENETFGELDGLESEKEIDLLNDDTFGSGALDSDWEATHQKLSALHDERLGGRGDLWSQEAKHGKAEEKNEKTGKSTVLDRKTDLDEEEEIIEQSLKSVIDDDDENESTAAYQSPSAYKNIPVPPAPAWEVSPLSSPTSSNSLQELISPSSNIWSSPVKAQPDKENANKGSSNIQSQLASKQSKPDERNVVETRPFSPAFEDDAIVTVKALPKLHPPSDFSRKPPIPSSAIGLEELERELSHTHIVQGTLDSIRNQSMSAQTAGLHGRPPPGIPLPMNTPLGFPRPPRPRYTVPPHMFQGRNFIGQSPMPNMPNSRQGLLGSRPSSMFPQPPYHLVHSDPVHLRHRSAPMDRQGMPIPFPRFSSPQMQNRRYNDNRFSHPSSKHRFENRQTYGQTHQSVERSERYHQHTVSDLDKKIHDILSYQDEERNENDPYAGLMSRKEKEWLMKIQLLQLTSQNPDLDDFYYQMYIKRKIAKERAQRGEGIESIRGRRNRNNRTTAGQMELPHFQREERDYKPVEFEGSLGKVSASSVQHPRQMVDIGHLSKTVEQDRQDSSTSTSTKESRRRRKIMMAIEKAYDLLMALEDMERKILHLPDSERNIFGENKQAIIDKMFALLKLKITVDLSEKVDDEFFVQLMSIRKGKVLLSRILPFLSQQQAGAVLLSLTRNLGIVMKKDSQDEVLTRLIDPATSVIEMASSGVTLQCTQNTVETAGPSLSLLLVNQFGANLLNTLLQKASPLSNSDQGTERWSLLVRRLASGFQDTPVKVVMKNLEAAKKLVQLLSDHTNQFTTVTMQEHLRLASSTKQIRA